MTNPVSLLLFIAGRVFFSFFSLCWLLHFSDDRSNLISPPVSITTFKNFLGISWISISKLIWKVYFLLCCHTVTVYLLSTHWFIQPYYQTIGFSRLWNITIFNRSVKCTNTCFPSLSLRQMYQYKMYRIDTLFVVESVTNVTTLKCVSKWPLLIITIKT